MFSPAEIAANYIEIGAGKAKLSIPRMLLLGIMAGIFISIAGVGSALGSSLCHKVVGAAIFPAGLAMVLLCGSELFTGNCLMVIPVLAKRTSIPAILKNWLFVYIGNMIGALAVTGLVVMCGTFNDPKVSAFLGGLALSKFSLSFGTAFIRGIFCNLLVCLGVWIAFAAKTVSGKIIGLFFPVFIFVLCGFEHSVANMFYIPAGIFMGVEGVTWYGFFITNLIPVTLGNIVGGGFLGFMYWLIYLNKKKEA